MKITADSHLDHDLLPEHIAWIEAMFGDVSAPFFTATVTLPDGLPPLLCGLHGPIMGDAPIVGHWDVLWMFRGARPYYSRVVRRPMRPTRLLTLVAGFHDGECILFTAFGGPLAPQEPDDPHCTTKEYSEMFWSAHALTAPDV